MTLSTFEELRHQAFKAGFDEVLERQWPANAVLEIHTHPFDVWAVVTLGELWLTAQGRTQHLRGGDTFELAAGEPHAERYGVEGASYWVARKNN